MAKLKIATVKAFSKEEAISNSGLNLEVKFDSTTAWKKEDAPAADSKYFEAFAEGQINKKIKGLAGAGCIVTVDSGIADSRERPYKVENVVTKGTRKWKTVYLGVVGADANGLGGTIVLSKDTKAEAEDAAKVYVTDNRVDVDVILGKEVIEGQAKAMTVKYAPSVNTHLGTYIVFGYEVEA